MSDLIPPMKGSNEQSDIVKKFYDMVNGGMIKSFVIAAVDTNGRSVIAQDFSNVIEGFGILKTAELAISSMVMNDEYEDEEYE